MLTNHETGFKLGMNSDHTLYDQLVLDPSLSATVHRNQYFHTGMDAYIHCVESLSGRFRNPAEAQWCADLSREHVGPHIYRPPGRFRCRNLEAPPSLHQPDMHFEVDTAEDYDVVCRLYEHFLPHNPGFSLAEAIQFARASGACAANRDVPRRWRAFRADDESR